YGIFVTTVSFTGFLASLSRLGIDAYLVRCEPAPDRKQYNLAFTLILATSTLLGVGGISLTPLLRYWYADGALVTPYLVLLLSVPLNGLAGPPTAKLERELKFRAVAGIEFGSQLAAFAVSISLAWRGAGVWAPVAGMFVWQFLALVVACRAARLRPRLVLFTGAPKRMLAFGFGFSASMRIWQLRSLVNPVLVGHFSGVEGVAFVAIAIRIVESLSFVRTAAGRLALATLARLQQDRQRFQNALESAMRCQLLALGPLLCGFALCGPWLVHRFMGDRWMPALHVYPFIAAGVLVNSLFSLQASALFVGGHYWPVAKAYASHVGLLAAGTFLLVPQAGLTGYGWAELFACGGYTFIHSKMSKVVSISYRRLIPWLAVFLLPLLAQAAGVPLFRVMVLSSLGVAGALTWQERRLRTLLKLACKPPKQNSHRRRIVTFVEKTRARGWPYVAAVGRYKLRSAAYVVRRASPLPQRLLTNSDVLVTAAFHFAPEDIPRIVASVPAQVKIKTLNEADRFLAQSFCFRGREYVFSGKIDWNFCPDGNFSWRWDLNRHAFFLNLATAYYYSQRPEYRAKLLSLWLDWMVQNPVARGPAWRYPFEVAARLQNWIWSYFLLAYSGLEQKGLRQLAAALVEHAEYLDAHLEYHWPNNHLLLEAKALYQFAILFPEAGKHFCRRARAVLEHEVLTQILPDGVHSELSSMYHRIIAGELWELALLCRRQRNPLSAAVEERVQRMQEFSRAVLREDGTVPLLGDSALHDTYLRFDS
ncbi:MAG TPA: oligosaccharide flippase family protein, partial [Terriglobales bacterium]